MTDPSDETQPTPTTDDPTVPAIPGGILPPPGAGSINPMPAGSTSPPDPAEGALPPIKTGPTTSSDEASVDDAGADEDAVDRSPPPLRADPGRSSTEWREPPWIPARAKDRRPNLAALIVGLALIAFGIYFFVDRTLGIALPTIAWRSLWPIALIIVGGLILVRSVAQRR